MRRNLPNNFNKNFQQKVFFNRSFPLERFILDNNRFPNSIEQNQIEKAYYSLIDNKIFENNKLLEKKAKKFNITYLNHFDLVCDSKNKKCLISTLNNEIIHRDGAGHISKNGGKFIAKKMIEKNWFNLN